MSPLSNNNAPVVRIPDEAALVRAAANGDQLAYGRLYSFYYPQLYQSLAFIARSHEDVQEIIHETFLKIWKTRESLELVRSFEDYAYIIAKNLLFNQLKRQQLGQRIMQALADQSVKNAGPTPDQDLLFKQYYETAMQAIHRLPEQKRRIFLLRTQEGRSLAEIALEMGISVSAVKKHLYGALETVKASLKQDGGDGFLFLLFSLF